METKICQSCKKDFDILPEDLVFYEKMKVPSPVECPVCRRIRRLAFANYTTLYRRKNNGPAGGDLISCYPEEAPFPVFDFAHYYGNAHHSEDYSIAYNENEGFFEQFKKLSDIVPRCALNRDPSNVGSDYMNYGMNMKNSFYSFGGLNSEFVDYSLWPIHTRESQDILISLNCELLYEAVFPEHSSRSSFIYFSKNLMDCQYMYDCRDCVDCIGCVNLRHKKFHVFNVDVGEAVYREFAKKLESGSFKEHAKVKQQFWGLVRSSPVRGERNEHATSGSTGIYMVHTKNVRESIWCLEAAESKWMEFTVKIKDSYDVTIGSFGEQFYNTALSGRQSWNNICTLNNLASGDCEYSIDLSNCTDCFGCIGLSNKKFCILNAQYTEEEYRKLVTKIKDKMCSDGTYGTFFPYELSPFPYNATMAQVIYPKTKEEMEAIGSYYAEPFSNVPMGTKIIGGDELPDTPYEVPADLSSSAIADTDTKRPFRIRTEDIVFYKRQKVPLPRLHPSVRVKERLSIVNRFVIEDCICEVCKKKFRGVLPSAVYRTYCDECYAKEIN